MKRSFINHGWTLAAAALLLLCAAHAGARQAAEPDIQRLSLPGKTWALDLDLGAFFTPASGPTLTEFRPTLASPGALGAPLYGYVATSNPRKDKAKWFAVLTVRVGPAGAGDGPEALRAATMESHRKSGRVPRESIRQSEYKQTPVLSYKLEGLKPGDLTFTIFVPGSPSPVQMSAGPVPKMTLGALEAYLVHDGMGITITYASTEIDAVAERQFHSLLDSVRVADTTQPSSSFDYYQQGRTLYQRKEYEGAVAALEKSLALEQAKRELPRAQLRGLVMTLAFAHASAGRPARAGEVLEFGAGVYPNDPFFHHGLARLKGSAGDLEGALASLRKVYELARSGFDAEFVRPLDPLSDPAFKQFKDDPRFRDAVRALKKQLKK